jgi:hypothetical protein
MTPTARTIKLLRKAGYLAEVVERWLPIPGKSVKRDLFHIADVLAVHPRQHVFLLVQCTSLGHVADRLAKTKGRPELATWLAAGGRFAVWGWFRRNGVWRAKQVEVRGEDLQDVEVSAPIRRRGHRPVQGELF